MLNLYFGDLEGAMRSGNTFFDFGVDFECITTDFAKKVIEGVEGGHVYNKNIIEHDLHDAYTPRDLSGGVKSLLILENTDKVMYLSCMGDNCIKYLSDICKHKDITLCSDTFRHLYRNGYVGQVRILNTGAVVDNDEDYIREYRNYARKA